MKIFIICSVRKQNGKEKSVLEEYILKLEKMGNKVHYPPRDTNQLDEIGTSIIRENLNAMREADEIHILWNPKSSGSLFDLGIAYALNKKIKLINVVKPTIGKSFSNVLLKLSTNHIF